MIQLARPGSLVASLPAPVPGRGLEVRTVADDHGWRGARALILDYLEWLAAASGLNPLDAQPELRRELADLPGWYGAPHGALLLATLDGEPAGVIGVRAHAPAWAELKRLYVRPAGRGYGLGKRLVRAALEAAERLGCQTVKLATAPGLMDQAVAMYRALGFQETARFDNLALDGVLYLERPLEPAARPAARDGAAGWASIGGPA
jgi:GNAT superfamily N-acetyltransferase